MVSSICQNIEVVFHLPNYLLFMAELCQGQVKLVPAKLDVTRKEIRNEGLFIIKGG
jgi:hypothetical protein